MSNQLPSMAHRQLKAAVQKQTETACQGRCYTPTLYPIWYAVMILGVNSYLIYQAARRYTVYQAIDELTASANLHLISLIIAAALMFLAAVIPFFRLGTYTNDRVQVGYSAVKKEIEPSKHHCLMKIWRGMLPIGPTVHLVISYLLLLPSAFTTAQGKRANLLSDPGDNLLGFLENGPVEVLLDNSTSGETVTLPSTTLELANMIAAQLIYTVSLSSVFWRTSHYFAIIFTAQLLFASALHLMSYLGFAVMYEAITLEKHGCGCILDVYTLTCLYILGNVVLFLSALPVFHFGYATCMEKVSSFLKRYDHLNNVLDFRSDCAAYAPHTVALVSILAFVGANGPIMYDYVTVYNSNNSRTLMTHLTLCVVYMLLWIIMWFAFTVKQNWDFTIQESTLKRFAIIQNRQKFFREEPTDRYPEDTPSSNSSVNQDPVVPRLDLITPPTGEDNLSNSTTSTNNENRMPNGILSQRKQKRRSSDQKVKFQEATKIVIETNLDSDLDTIPESSHEKSDSAVFSGSSESNHSPETSNSTSVRGSSSISSNIPLNRYSWQEGPNVEPSSPNTHIIKPSDIKLLQNGFHDPSHDDRRRMWSSTGDIHQTQGYPASENNNRYGFTGNGAIPKLSGLPRSSEENGYPPKGGRTFVKDSGSAV